MKKIKDTSQARRLLKTLGCVVRAFARSNNIEVVFSGGQCFTDGEKVYLPATEEHLTPEGARVLHGMADHETAHCIEEGTQGGRKTALQILKEMKDGSIPKARRFFFNVFEDIRIEEKYSKSYPGVAENLRASNAHAVDLLRQRHGSERNAWQAVGSAIVCRAKGLDEEWFPEGMDLILGEIQDLIDLAPSAEFSVDALALSEQAYARVKELSESGRSKQPEEEEEEIDSEAPEDSGEEGEDDDENESPEGEDSFEEDDSFGETTENEDGKGAGSEEEGDSVESESLPLDGEDSPEKEAEEEEEGLEGCPESDSASLSGGAEVDGEPSDPADPADLRGIKDMLGEECDASDISDIVREEIEKELGEAVSEGRIYVVHPISKAGDKIREAVPPDLETSISRRGVLSPLARRVAMDSARLDYERAKRDVEAQVKTLRARQQARLQTLTRARVRSGLSSGDIDGDALAGVRFGDRYIYEDTAKAKLVDTAIEVLIDLSGSMGASNDPVFPAYYAKRTAIALAESWERIRGLSCEFLGFHGLVEDTASAVKAYRDAGVEINPFGGEGGLIQRGYLTTEIFKAFHEPLRSCRERFSAIEGHGENCDGEHVEVAAVRLARRPEPRKILLVLSDGMPSQSGVPPLQGASNLRRAIKKATGAGLQVIGVGLKTSAPSHYYNEETGASSIVIGDLSRLASAMTKVLGRQIEGGVS